MFAITHTPRKFHANHFASNQYTPQYSSPLSSSPLRSSPSPLKERCDNLPSLMANANHPDGEVTDSKDAIMSSPTSYTKRGGASFHHEDESRLQHPSHQNHKPSSIFSTSYVTATPSSSHFQPPVMTGGMPLTPSSLQRGQRGDGRGNFSKRAVKPNPLLSRERGEEGRETRRKLFLKKVREGSDDKAWARRGGEEEMLRVLWVGERGREVERQRVEARLLEVEAEESLDEVMADEVAMMEKLELEALVSSQMYDVGTQESNNEGQTTPAEFDAHTPANTNYGSDDDEYDSIFQDVINEELRMSQPQPTDHQDHDMMDMS